MADTTSAAPRLLPCPFCGGPVDLEEAHPTRDSMMGERRWWGVVCRNAENRGGSCAIQQRPSASQEAAIERWNRRAPQPVAREPMTDEQIDAIWREKPRYHAAPIGVTDIEFARDIEAAAHGIGIKKGEGHG